MTTNHDPYVQFCLSEDARIDTNHPQLSGRDANCKTKKKRGFTQMCGIWGRREDDGLLEVRCNKYGQPDDQNATKLSNFIETLIRDGKNAPLLYENWHKVPKEYKDKMWAICQTKFNLDDSTKKWVMEKFGRKRRDWKHQLKKNCFKKDQTLEDLMKLKDPRVSVEHFGYLVNSWTTLEAQEISEKNKISRGKRKHNHTTGTKSFARVASEQAKQLGHAPSRTKKDGSQSSPVKKAISDMQEKELESNNGSDDVISKDDLYAQVMGQDKNGRVRMFGGGICPSLVFNVLSGRGVNQNSIIQSLIGQNNKLRDEIDQLKSGDKSGDGDAYMPDLGNLNLDLLDSDPTQPGDDDLSPILQVASREDWTLGSIRDIPLGRYNRTPKIGDEVSLKSILRPGKTIAIGRLYGTDPTKEVGGHELGHDHWEVYIYLVLMPNERLVKFTEQDRLMRDVIGKFMAWPICYVKLKEFDADVRG